MPVLNESLRQDVLDRIRAGQDDVQIRRETGFQTIKAMREIEALGLPIRTRIRKDGTLNLEPKKPRQSEEERRAKRNEYFKWRGAKLREAGVAKLGDLKPTETTIEPDGSVNITIAQLLPIAAKESVAKKEHVASAERKEKAMDHSNLILREAREFHSAWSIILKQEGWFVQASEKQAIVSALKTLRALTKRLINKVEEIAQ